MNDVLDFLCSLLAGVLIGSAAYDLQHSKYRSAIISLALAALNIGALLL